MDAPSHTAGRREPAINLPLALTAAIGLLLAIHGLREVLPETTDLTLLLEGGFFPAQWSIAWGTATPDAVVRAAIAGDPAHEAAREVLARYVAATGPLPWTWLTYGLLHGSWMHVGLNSLWLAAFGSPVFRRVGPVRAGLLALAAAPAGALAQWLADPLAAQPMIGASAVVSAFMAAAATFVFSRRAGGEAGPFGFLAERGALVFLGLWFAANLIFGLGAPALGLVEGTIAWEAHIGGLLAGLVVFPMLDPARAAGGFARPRA